MGEFFRRCGIGLLTIISSPLWLAYFALYIIAGIFLLVFTPLRLLIGLFTRHPLKIKSEYDRKAEAVLKGNNGVNQNIPSYMFNNAPTTTISKEQVNQQATGYVPNNQPVQPTFTPNQNPPMQSPSYNNNPNPNYQYQNNQVPPQQYNNYPNQQYMNNPNQNNNQYNNNQYNNNQPNNNYQNNNYPNNYPYNNNNNQGGQR